MTEEPNRRQAWADLFFHPVNLTTGVIVGSVIFLVLFAILGWDQGQVLFRLASASFARGLITYIFTVGTIGLSVVLVLGTLLGGEETKARFDRGKEILGLLLGVFGTIVGFYYGSAFSDEEKPGLAPLQVLSLRFSPRTVAAGATMALDARAAGGEEPLRYRVVLDPPLGTVKLRYVPTGGQIRETWTIPASLEPQTCGVRLVVTDAGGDSVVRGGAFTVTPRSPSSP